MSKSLTSVADLLEPTSVPFDRIFLDPNNPRIAEVHPPGYTDSKTLFDPELQKPLEIRVSGAYPELATLKESILKQGWIPIDPIIVWEHPEKKGYYIVVEGNTRTVALRYLRGERLEHEKKILEKLKAAPNRVEHQFKAQEETVEALEMVVQATNKLTVFPMAAKSVEELRQKLPRLLGVRHIAHAQEWNPYATNLFILSLYEELFKEEHGPKKKLAFDNALVKKVGDMVSRKELDARKNMQTASAFSDFKRRFEHRLPEGESFEDKDHYFFEQIVASTFTKEKFEFSKDRLELPEETAEVLFKWAFSKPRSKAGGSDDETGNENVFYKAESIGSWSKMNSYDKKHGTEFAKRLDMDAPDQAPSIRVVEADYLAHKARRSPVDTLDSLRKALQDLKVESLMSQQEHLAPMLEEIAKVIGVYRKMMDVANDTPSPVAP